jgi:hypothetical protein
MKAEVEEATKRVAAIKAMPGRTGLTVGLDDIL